LAERVAKVSNLLITGASHTGKSSLAASLSQALGWPSISTDSLARHPGRPWPSPPPHVAEFYAALSDLSIFQFLLHHHENMRPLLDRMLADSRTRATPCLWEGSAFRPEYFAPAANSDILMICLWTPAEVLQQRIHASCNYPDLTANQRSLVDRFLARTIADNDALSAAAKTRNIPVIDSSDPIAFAAARSGLLTQLGQR
jgi:2-phosphoglycerate kinase